MGDKGESEEKYLKTNTKELIDECNDIELLYLIRELLSAEKESGN